MDAEKHVSELISNMLTRGRTKIVMTEYDSTRNYEFKIENGIQEEKK